MKKLSKNEVPKPCKKCKHRETLKWLLGVKFCEYSRYTCVNRTHPCSDYETDYGKQLTIFD